MIRYEWENLGISLRIPEGLVANGRCIWSMSWFHITSSLNRILLYWMHAKNNNNNNNFFGLSSLLGRRFDFVLGSKLGTEFWTSHGIYWYWCIAFAGSSVYNSFFELFRALFLFGVIYLPFFLLFLCRFFREHFLHEEIDRAMFFLPWDKHFLFSSLELCLVYFMLL